MQACKHKEALLLKCKELVEKPPLVADLMGTRFFQLATLNTLLEDCEECKHNEKEDESRR